MLGPHDVVRTRHTTPLWTATDQCAHPSVTFFTCCFTCKGTSGAAHCTLPCRALLWRAVDGRPDTLKASEKGSSSTSVSHWALPPTPASDISHLPPRSKHTTRAPCVKHQVREQQQQTRRSCVLEDNRRRCGQARLGKEGGLLQDGLLEGRPRVGPHDLTPICKQF